MKENFERSCSVGVTCCVTTMFRCRAMFICFLTRWCRTLVIPWLIQLTLTLIYYSDTDGGDCDTPPEAITVFCWHRCFLILILFCLAILHYYIDDILPFDDILWYDDSTVGDVVPGNCRRCCCAAFHYIWRITCRTFKTLFIPYAIRTCHLMSAITIVLITKTDNAVLQPCYILRLPFYSVLAIHSPAIGYILLLLPIQCSVMLTCSLTENYVMLLMFWWPKLRPIYDDSSKMMMCLLLPLLRWYSYSDIDVVLVRVDIAWYMCREDVVPLSAICCQYDTSRYLPLIIHFDMAGLPLAYPTWRAGYMMPADDLSLPCLFWCLTSPVCRHRIRWRVHYPDVAISLFCVEE